MPRLLPVWFRLRLLPFLVWAVVVTCSHLQAYAFAVPPLEGRVNDRAGLLSPAVEQRLTARLAAHEQATGTQLAILTVDSLGGVPVEDYGIAVVEAWKLGKKGQDNGVLLLVAKSDRKMRIEVGYGLEGTLPDALAGRIVRDVMAPRFKQGNFEGGITLAVEAIIGKTGGTPEATATDTAGTEQAVKKPAPQPKGLIGTLLSIVFGLAKLAFFAFFVIIFIVFSLLGRLGGGRRGGSFYVGGGGFGGGGRSSSGGFDSFSGGGGGFGGGGASGDW